MLLDIVILPPIKVRRKIGRLTKVLGGKYRLAWRVDNKKLIPHITLYHLLSSRQFLPKIYSEIERLLKSEQPITLTADKAKGARIAFALGIKNKRTLSELHKKILKNLRKLCTGRTWEKFAVKIGPSKRLEKKYAKQYGVYTILKNYWPHITLGKLRNPNQTKEVINFLKNTILRNLKRIQ